MRRHNIYFGGTKTNLGEKSLELNLVIKCVHSNKQNFNGKPLPLCVTTNKGVLQKASLSCHLFCLILIEKR